MNCFEAFQSVKKICGIQSVDAAQDAIDAGADLLGVICVPNRQRTVDAEVAREISRRVKKAREHRQSNGLPGPFLVGVFRNQNIEDVERLQHKYGLDIIQLHGSEDWRQYKLKLGDTCLIKRFLFPEDCSQVLAMCQLEDPGCVPLFDSEAGGTGEKLDWNSISEWSQKCGAEFILAGGLTPENVKLASQLPGVRGVDVSGGVETDGVKDSDKIKTFLREAFAS
ncbi:LANO_0C03752g1_1 [Lachancea nothofagi CBS 11611]|uniref:N-(5'-phosphoribosyl)anthranilate isomerase n=1 Tax=Lachancea nothofagi CBS 11611 TaxID=1266666 RepID=A0A1G4J6A5_9SACH|nr:LANO_0C03752g1_1 [Lachancea nothofagi CBS 11611]